MPQVDPSLLIPFAPLHWTSILHYLILLGALAILVGAQSDVSLFFIFALAFLALVTGADLYAHIVNLPRLVIFMMRVAMVGVPFLLAGFAPAEQLRSVAVLMGILGALLFIAIFTTCPIPFLGDPRIASWCG
jgi:hypothetical protein